MASMRVAIHDAGPAGLYLSCLLKRRRPEVEVGVIEQNSPDPTLDSESCFPIGR
jgi:2-polyprenyl-6-methoxyphenol hydroxylase-like FAD-dependent oxidoreductase